MAHAGRTAAGRIKRGHHLTHSGRVVKAAKCPPKKRVKKCARRVKRRTKRGR